MADQKNFFENLINETFEDVESVEENNLSFEDYFALRSGKDNPIFSVETFENFLNENFVIFFKGEEKQSQLIDFNLIYNEISFPINWSVFGKMNDKNFEYYIIDKETDSDLILSTTSTHVPYTCFLLVLKIEQDYWLIYIPESKPELFLDIIKIVGPKGEEKVA